MKLSDIPREKIPWYPRVDADKCTGCRRICVESCSHETYDFNEAAGKAVVARPFNCVVGCTGCEAQCPVGAISFPPLSMLRTLTGKEGCDCGSCNDCGCR